MSAEEAELYRLPADPMQDFSYLNQSGCSSIEGVDDATDFATLKSAMTAVGINHQQQTEVFEVLAGILWLGNIQFSAPTDDSVCVEPGVAVANAAALLQISETALTTALTSRNIVARRETIVTQLKLEGAVDARDALAKAIYAGVPACQECCPTALHACFAEVPGSCAPWHCRQYVMRNACDTARQHDETLADLTWAYCNCRLSALRGDCHTE